MTADTVRMISLGFAEACVRETAAAADAALHAAAEICAMTEGDTSEAAEKLRSDMRSRCARTERKYQLAADKLNWEMRELAKDRP
jgi:hypothetical protein